MGFVGEIGSLIEQGGTLAIPVDYSILARAINNNKLWKKKM
jgi:hypothetical protein